MCGATTELGSNDQAEPDPFKSQIYIEKANHNYFNREWVLDDGQFIGLYDSLIGSLPARTLPLSSRSQHERILLVYASAFYRATLGGENSLLSHLSNHVAPRGVPSDNIDLSFEWVERLVVDNHEELNGIGDNSLGGPTDQNGVDADEFAFHQSFLGGLATFNSSFYGESIGMVLSCEEDDGVFRSELVDPVDLLRAEIWIRCCEVYESGSAGPGGQFDLGVEDASGHRGWVGSDALGGLPLPHDRRTDDVAAFGQDFSKTMLSTLRAPGHCFLGDEDIELDRVVAILLRCPVRDALPIAFDDLHIVERMW